MVLKLAFIVDLTDYLNKQNVNLQGKNKEDGSRLQNIKLFYNNFNHDISIQYKVNICKNYYSISGI